MEFFFLNVAVRTEVSILVLLAIIIIIIAFSYGYGFIERLRMLFGSKKRDAILSKKDVALLKKRSKESRENDTITADASESHTPSPLPPPIVLEELTHVEAVTLEEKVQQNENSPTASEESDARHEAITSDTTATIQEEAKKKETIEPLETEPLPQESPETQEAELQEPVKSQSHTPSESEHESERKEKASIQKEKESETIKAAYPEIEDKDWDEVADTIQYLEEDASESQRLITGDSDAIMLSQEPLPTPEPIAKQEEPPVPTEKKTHSSPTEDRHIEEIFEIMSQAKTLIARGKYTEARTQVIQWLSYNRSHRELNLLLGEIYEYEKKYPQAEIVYKDLATILHEDAEVLQKLANILIITKNYPVAYELYKKVLTLGHENEDTLFIIANIAYELGLPEELYGYAKKYIKSWPSNKDMLRLLSEAELATGRRKDAIQTLIKLKNLSPYSAHEIAETIQKLVAEEEMAKNFNTN